MDLKLKQNCVTLQGFRYFHSNFLLLVVHLQTRIRTDFKLNKKKERAELTFALKMRSKDDEFAAKRFAYEKLDKGSDLDSLLANADEIVHNLFLGSEDAAADKAAL